MFWIGLTGGIGSGKSSVCRILRELDIPVLDADEISHQVLSPGTPTQIQVLKTFGDGLLNADGHLDRRALGKIVFNNKEKLSQLEAIIHPEIQKKIIKKRAQFQGDGHFFAIYDIPLLFETSQQNSFDKIIVVDCPTSLRVERVILRDGLSKVEVMDRIKSQWPLEEKVLIADYVIDNSLKKSNLTVEVQRVIAQLKLDLKG